LRFLFVYKPAYSVLTLCLLFTFSDTSAQVEDSTVKAPPIRNFFHNIYEQVIDAVTIDTKDTTERVALINTKSEKPYQRYEGKIVRNINVEQLRFERTFSDTSRRINYFGTRILNALHKDTREYVVRENLFIRKNTPLIGFLVADNERHLRTLNFIQDARIIVKHVRGSRDSVDIFVVTKDFFTKSGGIDVNGISRVRLKVSDNNFMGMGQRIQLTTLIQKNRKPVVGYELAYTKTSIANTFINASVGYTQINTGRSDGSEDEKSIFLRMDRPLVSQYMRFAGGFEVSYNSSENFYRKPDSMFYRYKYNIIDSWIG
jgi:hypothetical protein